MDLLYVFLSVIKTKEGQIKKTQFEDSRSNGFVSMRKLIFFTLGKVLFYISKLIITLMDPFMYFQVAFGFLLPVFSLFFS